MASTAWLMHIDLALESLYCTLSLDDREKQEYSADFAQQVQPCVLFFCAVSDSNSLLSNPSVLLRLVYSRPAR